jgi:hypothetical protein
MMIFNVAFIVKTEWRMAVACSDLLGSIATLICHASESALPRTK